MSVKQRLKQRRFHDSAEAAIVSLLVAAGALLQGMNDVLRPHGITHDQFNVLRILRGAGPRGLARSEVGSRMTSRAPDVTRLLDRLARQGLVSRGWAPENRRLSIARITPAGLSLLDAVDPELRRLQHGLTRGIPDAKLRIVAEVCDRLVG